MIRHPLPCRTKKLPRTTHNATIDSMTAPTTDNRRSIWFVCALLFVLAGGWLVYAQRPIRVAEPQRLAVPALGPGAVAAMDSSAFHYSDDWRVTAAGADPSEPADPWNEPAGVVTFNYTGRQMLLAVQPGNYWGYIYVTVDGKPANQLPAYPRQCQRAGKGGRLSPLDRGRTQSVRHSQAALAADPLGADDGF